MCIESGENGKTVRIDQALALRRSSAAQAQLYSCECSVFIMKAVLLHTIQYATIKAAIVYTCTMSSSLVLQVCCQDNSVAPELSEPKPAKTAVVETGATPIDENEVHTGPELQYCSPWACCYLLFASWWSVKWRAHLYSHCGKRCTLFFCPDAMWENRGYDSTARVKTWIIGTWLHNVRHRGSYSSVVLFIALVKYVKVLLQSPLGLIKRLSALLQWQLQGIQCNHVLIEWLLKK